MYKKSLWRINKNLIPMALKLTNKIPSIKVTHCVYKIVRLNKTIHTQVTRWYYLWPVVEISCIIWVIPCTQVPLQGWINDLHVYNDQGPHVKSKWRPIPPMKSRSRTKTYYLTSWVEYFPTVSASSRSQ